MRPQYVEGEAMPISPVENQRMVIAGKKPYWLPRTGARGYDLRNFCPRQNPDNFINHFVWDGGPKIDYSNIDDVQPGWFGISYSFVATAGGATPTPNTCKIPDISEWKKYIEFPNLDDFPWDEVAEMNKDYLASEDRINHMWFKFGFWERLMNAMGVSEAAMALIDEDDCEYVKEFFEALADYYIEYIKRMTKIVRLDNVFFHDDWGHANGPFFSVDTCREVIVPPFKRVVDACHEMGLVVDYHCCGAASSLVPCMIEVGVDSWQPQPSLNDIPALVDQYKDEPIVFITSTPELHSDWSVEKIDELAKEFVEQYKDKKVMFGMNQTDSPNNDRKQYDAFEDAVYKYSRIAFQDVED